MQTRRDFVAALGVAGAVTLLPRSLVSMQTTSGTANVAMEQNAYRPVNLVAKANASASMTDEARDDLEHQVKCQCGCVLDVFTCRTTDFSCSVSPAMHKDVMRLVSGGYNSVEILAAFQGVYGERVLMAPLKQGFNWVGYLMPFAAIVVAGSVTAGIIRKWGRRARNNPQAASVNSVDASPEEMEALQAAIRDDS